MLTLKASATSPSLSPSIEAAKLPETYTAECPLSPIADVQPRVCFRPIADIRHCGKDSLMATSTDTYIRWEPLPDLPEHPFGGIEVSYSGGSLTATSYYAIDAPLKGVRIDFGRPEAFKVYEEFSDPWMEHASPQPMVVNPQPGQWAWPLQEVRTSVWVSRVLARNGGLVHWNWRHFVIVTMDVTLHVMVNHEPKVELIT
jgi:hypothetical protein